MKFLVDAQLPRRLCRALQAAGHDVLHTLDLPDANRTLDREINRISAEQERAVITKDTDFVDSFLLHKEPYKLLLVTTGNIGNTNLIKLVEDQLATIADSFTRHDFLELTRDSLLVHA